MALVSTVTAVITAKTAQFHKNMTAAQKSLANFSQKAATVGPALTKGVTLPMAAIAGASIKAAADFEASMTKIETLVGRTAEEVEMLQGEVLKLSGETARAPKELADAMFFITSAGLPAAEAVETLEYAAKAAAIGLGNTERIADAVTNAINGYGKENISASLATDILAKTVEQGKASAESLAPTFGRLIPMAAELGIEFDQVGGGLAYMTRSSGDAAMSATQLGQVMRTVLKPSQQANDVLNAIGYSSEELRADVEDDLLGALVGLRQKLEDSGYEMSNVFENARALIGALSLTARGGEDAAEVFAAMEDSAGKVDTAFARVQETSQFKLQQSMASLKTALVDVGNVLIPILVPILKTMAEVVGGIAKAFAGLDGPIKKVTMAFLGLAAAAGPLTTMGGKVAAGFASMGPAATRAGAAVGPKKGFGYVLGKTMGIMKKHPVAAAAVVAGGLALNHVFSGMRKRAKEANDRMEMLRQEMIDAGDPTATMTERVKELAEKLAALKTDTDEGEESITSFRGSTVLLSELIKRDVVGEFNDLGIEMGTLIPLVHKGTDEFHKLGDQTKHLVRDEEAFIQKLQTADASILGVTYALGEQIKAGELTTQQAREIMIAMDETADAFDDYRKAIESQAKEYLTSDAGIIAVTNSLGLLGAQYLDAAGDSMTYTEAQEAIDNALQVTDTAINGNIGGWLGYGDVVPTVTEAVEEHVNVTREQFEAWREEQRTLEDLNAEYEELLSNVQELTDEAYDFAESEIALADAFDKMTEALLTQDDPLTQVDERQKAILEASREWANELVTLADNMADMPIDEVNAKFAEQSAWLEGIREEIGEEEYTRLKGILDETAIAAEELNGKHIDIIFGITDEGLGAFRNMVSQFTNVQDFGASVAGFVGSGNPQIITGALPFAEGGIVTGPTLGLIGEQGPEAVIPLDRLGGGSGVGATNVTVNVQGSVLAEYDLAETIQNQLVRIKGRNASLEFG